MAEKDLGFNTAADPSGAALSNEPLNLKKRARRRLVGAIVLALLAVIVLPMVMDQEPQPLTQDIQILIPRQEPGAASPLSRLVPNRPVPTPLPTQSKSAVPAPAPEPPVAATPAAQSESKATALTQPKAEPPKATVPVASAVPVSETASASKAAEKSSDKPAAKSSSMTPKPENARAAAQPNGEQWEIQLGAYKDPANVKALQARLKENGYPSFTEKVETPQGERIRVRGGPFASRETAEMAQARLKKLSVGAPAGGVVAQKP